MSTSAQPTEIIFDLIRHAHTDWSPDDARPLSATGRRAAQRVAQCLGKPSAERPAIHRIISSPSPRARQTVAPLAERMGLPIAIDSRLSERRLGIIAPDSAAFQAAVRRTWDDPDFRYPGGESNREAQTRGMAFIEELQRTSGHQHIVLATHGNLLALILQAFDPTIGFKVWSALTMPDIYRLHLRSPRRAHYQRLWQPWPGTSGEAERDPT